MTKLTEELESIHFNAKHRHASTEEATASIVGLVKAIEGEEMPEEQKVSYALFALTHIAVLFGNIASALNETAASVQAMSALAHENFRQDQAEIERQRREMINPTDRDFIGKKRN